MAGSNPFQGIERLYSKDGLARLSRSTVMVVGLGGVGSWSAEALARSGVGNLVLVDLDEICVSNINRQIHALEENIGAMKAQKMKERIVAINPQAGVRVVEDFFSAATMEEILSIPCDYIIDAIDGVKSKSLLIAECKKRDLPLVVTGGAGGKVDPTLIQMADLNRSYNCRLLAQTRKKLKVEHGFSRDKKRKYGVSCVFSPEEQREPPAALCATGEEIKSLNCQNGYGSSVMVTATFGLMAAARVVNDLSSRATTGQTSC